MSVMSELDLLRDEYIEHILEGCDMDDLTDMARSHLRMNVSDNWDLIEIIRENAPYILIGTRFEHKGKK